MTFNKSVAENYMIPDWDHPKARPSKLYSSFELHKRGSMTSTFGKAERFKQVVYHPNIEENMIKKVKVPGPDKYPVDTKEKKTGTH